MRLRSFFERARELVDRGMQMLDALEQRGGPILEFAAALNARQRILQIASKAIEKLRTSRQACPLRSFWEG